MDNLDEFIGTTEMVERENLEFQEEEERFTCAAEGCETVSKISDEGINLYMHYCHSCNIKLRVALNEEMSNFNAEGNEPFPDDQIGHDDVGDGEQEEENIVELDAVTAATTEDICKDLDVEEISTSLMSLARTRDKRQIATIRFGEQ